MLVAVIDSETTGLQPGTRLVELACCIVDTDLVEIIRSFETMVNPGMPIPADVTAIHGITDAMVVDAPNAGNAIMSMLEFMGDVNITVIQNAPYDMGIILWDAARHDVIMPALMFVDTVEIAKSLKLTKNNKLETLAEFHSLKRVGSAHRAASDVNLCARYFLLHHDYSPVPLPWASSYSFVHDFPQYLSDLPSLVADAAPLTFVYKDAKDNESERTITPYGWANHTSGLHFHGYCHLRNERREFRADRVVSRIHAIPPR